MRFNILNRINEFAPLYSSKLIYSGHFCNPIIEKMMANFSFKITEEQRKYASCHLVSNTIDMPHKKQFNNPAHFYATEIHEAIHLIGSQNQSKTMTDYSIAFYKYEKDLQDPVLQEIKLALDTNAIIDKWDKGQDLHPKEINLLCAYMKEELRADIVATSLIKMAGYELTKDLKGKRADTVMMAKEASALIGLNFVSEFRDKSPSNLYRVETKGIHKIFVKQLCAAEKELGLTSKDYVAQHPHIEKSAKSRQEQQEIEGL